MRAAQYDRYGDPSVLYVGDAPIPEAGPGEVLVRVAASSVNHIDATARSGSARPATGFRFPKGTGVDFAGEVAAVGPGVGDLAPADRVWGFLPGLPRARTAAAAEFVVSKRRHLALTPSAVDVVDAAGLPLVGVTALVALRTHAKLQPGGRLLVRGASGGVGTVAVQLAKAMGAHVTALTSGDTLDFVRALGADAALDYHTHGPSSLGTFDAILDLTGTRLSAYRALLAPKGRMVTTATRGIPYILFSTIFGPRRVRAFIVAPSSELLADLAGFVDDGTLKPVVEKVFPLEQIAAAHGAIAAGGVRGKVVVTV
jgi:NADPH:quinone reductase-like Zn-dependent oxidoreductase